MTTETQTPQVIQNEALFAAYGEHVFKQDVIQGREVFHTIGQLAIGNPPDFLLETVFDGTDFKTRQQVEDVRFMQFLETLGPDPYDAEPVQERIELLQAYDAFAPLVAPITDLELDQSGVELLGRGAVSETYAIEKDGQQYVARTIHNDEDHITLETEYVQGMLKAKGKKGLEQIVAVSYKDNMVISERAAGRTVDRLTTEDIAAITDQQLIDLVAAAQHADDLGIVLDMFSGNILYDKEAGFTIVDLSCGVKETNRPIPVRLRNIIMHLHGAQANTPQFDGIRDSLLQRYDALFTTVQQ